MIPCVSAGGIGGGGGDAQGPLWAAERPRGPLPGSPGVASLRLFSSPETLPTPSLGIAGETGFSPECTQKSNNLKQSAQLICIIPPLKS